MTANRIVLALEGHARRRAAHLYGEILAYVADHPARDYQEREALGVVLDFLDRRREGT